MGTDFLRAKAKRFRKGLDRSVIELTRATLFSREPGVTSEKVVAKAVGSKCVGAGDQVLLHAAHGRLWVELAEEVRGEVVKPDASFLKRLEGVGGYVGAVVAASHPTLNLFEVTLVSHT